MSMSEPTQTDLSFLENDDQTTIYIQLVTPLIQAAVRSETAPNNEAITRLVETELHKVRTDVAAVNTSALDLQATVKQQQIALQRQMDDQLRNWNAEDARRYAAFEQRYEQLGAMVLESQNRSIQNEKEIAALKATSDQRYEQMQKEITSIRRDIDVNVKSVSDSARRMDSTFAKFIEKSDKRIDKIEANASVVARDVVRAGKAIEDIHEQRGVDIKEVRRIEGIVNTESRIVRDIEGRVILDMTRMNAALYGDEKEKEPGLVADMKTVKRGLWWQTWIGIHPYKSILIAGAMYVAFLIVTAFVLNRPEIVARMILPGSNNPN